MGYLHFEIDGVNRSRHQGAPCGDTYVVLRQRHATVVALADGLGHGARANIASNMYLARIVALLKNGYSLREAFTSVVSTLDANRSSDLPFAALTLVQCGLDGQTTLLSYDSPGPIYISSNMAMVLDGKTSMLNGACMRECQVSLFPGDGLLIFSDGVSQAGMGRQMGMGWGEVGVSRYVNALLQSNVDLDRVPARALAQALVHWGAQPGDDMTAVLIAARHGAQLNILTGPPRYKKDDARLVKAFRQAGGKKVVSGASTAQMVARVLGVPLTMQTHSQTAITPPHYSMVGMDLMTEGAVTLNQVHNLLHQEPELVRDIDGPVGDLCRHLFAADSISFFVGRARNVAQDDVTFTQLGLLPRRTIVPMIQDSLEKLGKRVVVTWY